MTKTVRSLSLTLATLLALSACGRGSAFQNSNMIDEKDKLDKFTPPTTPLSPTSSKETYSVYSLITAKFAVDKDVQSLSAHITVRSNAGLEEVEMVGMIRPDGSSSLVDLSPLLDGKNRLVGEALCVDRGVCQKIILNIYYNVGGKTQKKQFSSDTLKAETAKPTTAPTAEPTGPADAPTDAHPTEKGLADETSGSDEQQGDFVGAPRNEILIGKLWPRSETPELPPVIARAEEPTLNPVLAGGAATPPLPPKPKTSKPAAPKPVSTKAPVKPTAALRPTAQAGRATHPAPSASTRPTTAGPGPRPTAKTASAKPASPSSPQTESSISRWMRQIGEFLVPPLPKPAPRHVLPKAQPAAPLKPLAPPVKAAPLAVAPPAKPAPVVVPQAKPVPPSPVSPPERRPLPVKPLPQPIPQQPLTNPTTPPVAPVYPFPPARPGASDSELDQKITLLEAKLAPLMNLRDGGEARGSYGYSREQKSEIIDASVLPSNIPGLRPITVNANAHFGSGMLVSFLENAATYFLRQFGLSIFVGDMSLKTGGKYGRGSSHNTHRNGLDADIAYVGIDKPLRDSALTSSGAMVRDFDFEKTWDFLKIAAKQELVEDGAKTSAVSRVYMSHRVKDGFCSWAKEKNLLSDPFNLEVLRTIRREQGHHKHFHLSLKCSPHYPLCRNLAGPPPAGPGCR